MRDLAGDKSQKSDDDAQKKGGLYGPADFCVVLFSERVCGDDIDAASDSDDECRDHDDQCRGGADASECKRTGETADDRNIGHIKENLKQIGCDQRNSEEQNSLPKRSFGQVCRALCGRRFSFSGR